MEHENFSNLTLQRSEVDAWERRGWRRPIEDPIAPSLMLAGAGLLVLGVTRHSNAGRWWILCGAALLGWTAASRGAGQWLGSLWQRGEDEDDIVTIESLDSFPASDPPSSNVTTAG
jgi:hypothetical protein